VRAGSPTDTRATATVVHGVEHRTAEAGVGVLDENLRAEPRLRPSRFSIRR
jgi:hypothetical protein